MAVGTDQLPSTSKEFLLGGIAIYLLVTTPDIPMFIASLGPTAARIAVYDVRALTRRYKGKFCLGVPPLACQHQNAEKKGKP
ncbi:hypothetical protein N7481_010222 [Penicillium waksmanii]|uniref:uncharacterized protein n=1 Tax=Penicillium waksmanii TaxID=69791 RepID=UPI0025465F3A|nr:uncharacterized protein N7481_010222 [Penicillium waksmanii]KAJ5976515.1 hypothetical protein N7481_010222 [Penicillium waksmanii]